MKPSPNARITTYTVSDYAHFEIAHEVIQSEERLQGATPGGKNALESVQRSTMRNTADLSRYMLIRSNDLGFEREPWSEDAAHLCNDITCRMEVQPNQHLVVKTEKLHVHDNITKTLLLSSS